MYGALRPILFRIDPERAHELAMHGLRRVHGSSSLQKRFQRPIDDRLAVSAFGRKMPTPLGIAAGFDKEAAAYNALLALGFGHVEVGTVTPVAQPGNPKPRIARLPRHKALINRMGFPGPGAEGIHAAIHGHSPIGTIGINLGPNKDTGAEQVPAAIHDMAKHLSYHADYLAVNVSSPNTPGLRSLQTPDGASRLVQAAIAGADAGGHSRPILLKLHPDNDLDDTVAVARAAMDAGAAGIIAVNTTTQRPPGTEHPMQGGLSGAPLHEGALNVVSALHHGLGRDATIIGVGGVFTGADVLAMMQAGASLVQAYTGFIYRGPRMARYVHRELLAAMDHAGIDRIADAIGTA